MLLFCLFLLFAAAVTAVVVRLGAAAWLAALCFLPAFLLAHVLYVFICWLLTFGWDPSAPDGSTSPAARKLAVVTGRYVSFFGGARPRLTGLDKLPEKERFLFVCNHRSMFDPLIAMGWLGPWEIAFISKPSNLKIPLIGRAARTAGFLAIDRENDREALKTILTAVDYLKRGVCSVGIYPEGTRSRTGELLPFHSGSFKIAQRAKAPLVIACVHGTEKLRHGFLLHPRPCWLEILETVPAETVRGMSTQELAAYSRERIEARLKEVEGT